MLNNKDGFHLVPTAFLDGEWLVFESFNSARSREVNSDVGSTLDFLEVTLFSKVNMTIERRRSYQSKRFDDTFARVVGISNGFT